MRKNPELEPLSQFVVVTNLVLETPATALVSNRNSFAVPLDQSVAWRGRGRVLHGQQPVLHISSSGHTSELASHTDKTTLQTGEDTPASPCGVDTTRGAAVTGYKPSHDWRKARCQGLLPTVGGILGSPGLEIDISRQWTIGPPVLETWWSCQISGGSDVGNRQY